MSAVYEEIKGNVRNTLNGAICALVEDGWSNVKKDPVIATCVQHNGKTYFLRAVDTGSAHKDAEFNAQVARDSILAAANDFGARVGSVVTDNAAVMNLAREKLKETDPTLLVYGCSAHMANLLASDISPSDLIANIKSVQIYFKNHHEPSGLLREIVGARRPVIPCVTRWGSQFNTVDNFLHNHVYYIQIVQSHPKLIEKKIKEYIKDWNLFAKVLNNFKKFL